MKATAKNNVNYNGIWYRVGEVLNVAAKDKDELAKYCAWDKTETYNDETDFDNERKYLNRLVEKGGGNGEWAKAQLKQLDEAENGTSAPRSKRKNSKE